VCEQIDVVANSIESATLTNLTTRPNEAKAQGQLSLHDNALDCILDTTPHVNTMHTRSNTPSHSLMICSHITMAHILNLRHVKDTSVPFGFGDRIFASCETNHTIAQL
jgi:hypothetical protein